MSRFRSRYFAASFLAACLLLSACSSRAQSSPVYQDPKAPVEDRVTDLLARMTQDEKLGFLTGTGFTTQPIPRLGVPAMGMADAGQGVRGGTGSTQGPATLFPSGIAMASTWDTDLISSIGQAIGEEVQNKGEGAQILLGPDVNIHRSPLAGRNGESFSEDPYLSAQLAASYIRGLQSTGAGACVKHYDANNEEVDRGYVNVRVGERALREIYLPSFEAAIKEGHVWSLMSAYNRVNGPYCTANPYLLTDVLRTGWGFDGLVMSDWGAVHETAGVLNAGNDLEMPGGDFMTRSKVSQALAKGEITQARIDEAVRRILRTVIRVGLLDGPKHPDHSIVDSPAHRELTYRAASESLILLKNQDHILPLDARRIHSIALIGPGVKGLQMGAAGSPGLEPAFSIQPFEGISQRAGSQIAIHYAKGVDIAGGGSDIPSAALTPPGAAAGGHGLQAEYFANEKLEGAPALTRIDPRIDFNWPGSPAPGVGHEHFSARWTGVLTPPVTGHYQFFIDSDDGARLFLDGKTLIDNWHAQRAGNPATAAADLVAGQHYNLRVEYFQGIGDASIRFGWLQPGQKRFTEAVDAARQSDVAVVFASTMGTEGEGQDRPSMDLPGGQDDLIQAVSAANKTTIVVLNNGTPVTMTGWLDRVPGLIESWFPGEEGGRAIAAVLFGDANPSGRLPDTLGARREDYPDFGHFPGKQGVVDYAEGIYVGYRHFDKAGIQPLFPFGYGLSYTTFRYSHLKIARPTMEPTGTLTGSVDVTNTGRREGAEVVELYLRDSQPREDRPVRELKAFTRVDLQPGETRTVAFTLTPRALAYCDVAGKQWKADAGEYEIEVGSSSRDLRARAGFRLTGDYTEPIPGMAVGTGEAGTPTQT